MTEQLKRLDIKGDPPPFQTSQYAINGCFAYNTPGTQEKNKPATGRLIIFSRNDKPRMTKPVFMMWGFDTESGAYNAKDVYYLLNGGNWPHGGRDGQDRMLDRLLDETDADVCVVLPDDSKLDLRANAFLLVRAVEDIYTHHIHPKAASAFIGLSAGGVITRWALNWMEDHLPNGHEETRYKAYISYDSPHRGANVPLSMQYLFNNINAFGLAIGDIATIVEKVNCPAARQLSVWHLGHHATISSNPPVDPLRIHLLGELGNRWPKTVKKYLIANGSGGGDPLQVMPGGDIYTGLAVQMCAMPRNADGGTIFRTLVPGIPNFYVGPGYQPLDSAPGSYTQTFYPALGAHPLTFSVHKVPETCFVPTTSALDITDDVWYGGTGDRKWNEAIAQDPLWGGYHVPPSGKNDPHVYIDRHNTNFIVRALSQTLG